MTEPPVAAADSVAGRAGVEAGAELTVDVRGRPQAVQVVKPPFVPSRVR